MTKYWVVKGRPDQNALSEWLVAGNTGTWRTKKPPREWAVGDRIFIWEAAPKLRIVGLAEIRSFPPPDRDGTHFFELGYLTSHLEAPLGIDELRDDLVVGDASFLKAGAAGTVFPVDPAQARRIGKLSARYDSVGHEVLRSWFGEDVIRSKVEREADASVPLVLIVDTDARARTALANWVAKTVGDGAAVLEAEDGEDAWAMIQQYRPAMIVASDLLTTISGLELAERIDAQPEFAEVKRVMVVSTESSLSFGLDARWTMLRKPVRVLHAQSRISPLLSALDLDS